MDERLSCGINMAIENTWQVEKIPGEDIVYRQVHILAAPKKEGRRIPNEANFSPDGDGLSVHWNKYITIEGIYQILGLSYNAKNNYINFTQFKVYGFPINFVRSVSGINDVIHSPVINGNPAPVGHPNNRAHASVMYPDDEEIRLKLADYVLNNYQQSYCDVDVSGLSSEIQQLRERLNNTPYHCL